MKETTKMSRAVGQLEKMYNTINLDLWGGQLPTPIITVQSKPGTYGHCSVGKVWKRKDGDTYEMNIAAEALDVEIEEVLDTLIHEMVHLYCRENGIQEVSRGGKYHNGKFKEIAEEHLLICHKTGIYGWNTQGKDNDRLTAYALEKGWNEIRIARSSFTGFRGIAGSGAASSTPTAQNGGTKAEQHAKADLPEVREQRPSDKGGAHHVYGLHGADAGGVSMVAWLMAASVSWCLCGIIFAMDKTD